MNYLCIDCRYYLYRYIRLDTNEPFYIGVGTKSKKSFGRFKSHTGEYSRAYTKHTQNPILNKSDIEWDVEIIYEHNDYEHILLKEIEFIKLYGRKNLATGCLANLTDGGEFNKGRVGKKMSDTNKKRQSERMKLNNPNKDGKYLPFDSEGVREKVIERMKTNNPRHLFIGDNDIWKKKCYQYDLDGNFIKKWESQKEALESIPLKISISNCIKGISKTAGGFQWKSEKFDKIPKCKRKTGYTFIKQQNKINEIC